MADETYHVVKFRSYQELAAFQGALQQFFTKPDGIGYLGREPRCIVWSAGSISDLRLFLTTSAASAARAAGLSMLAESVQIGFTDLPEGKALLIGEQSAWDGYGRNGVIYEST